MVRGVCNDCDCVYDGNSIECSHCSSTGRTAFLNHLFDIRNREREYCLSKIRNLNNCNVCEKIPQIVNGWFGFYFVCCGVHSYEYELNTQKSVEDWNDKNDRR